jgi:hypothetical protein
MSSGKTIGGNHIEWLDLAREGKQKLFVPTAIIIGSLETWAKT